MKDELMKELMALLMSAGFDTEDVRSRLIIILDKYEVTQKTTELMVVDENDIIKYVRRFLVSKRVAGRTERTLRAYQQVLKSFFSEVQKSPLDIMPDDIRLYLATKEIRDGASKVHQSNILRVLSSFYAWMQSEEYMVRNPINRVEKIKVPKKKKSAFTEMDIEKIRMAADGDIKMQCIIEILLSTWCRVSELAQMKISDITDGKESVVVHGKGSKDRTCYFNAKAQMCVDKYLKQRNDSNPYLFPKGHDLLNTRYQSVLRKYKKSRKEWWQIPELVEKDGHQDHSAIESLVRRLGRKAGVPDTHPHRFRRTGATFALRRGMPVEQVSKLLGHESINTTQIYLDISEQEIAQAHHKYV